MAFDLLLDEEATRVTKVWQIPFPRNVRAKMAAAPLSPAWFTLSQPPDF